MMIYQAASPGVRAAVDEIYSRIAVVVRSMLNAAGALNAFSVKNTAPLGPATSLFLDTTPIIKKKSGLVLVTATVNVTGTNPGDNVLIALRMDGAISNAPGSITLGIPSAEFGGAVTGTLSWIFTLPDTLPHTFGIAVQEFGTGTLSALANQASVSVMEL